MTASNVVRPYAEVIGDPIEHSKSPIIHGFWLERLGIDAAYRRARVGRADLASYLAERRTDPAWRGCNVTMPIKGDALLAADHRSEGAVQAGAANLLVPQGDGLRAGNTDIQAVSAVLERLCCDGPPQGVTLLGSGGAARAALVALQRRAMEQVTVQARNLPDARKLAAEFGFAQTAMPFDSPITSEGLINATPLGMRGAPPLHIDLGRMPKGAWVFDMVSVPAPTGLVSNAQRQGLRAIGGTAMLVEQAAEAFSLLFGAQPPRDGESDAELLRRLAG